MKFEPLRFDHLEQMAAIEREAFDLPWEPLLILGVGKGAEQIELVEIGAEENRAYYRRNGVHYVPKIRVEELLIGK